MQNSNQLRQPALRSSSLKKPAKLAFIVLAILIVLSITNGMLFRRQLGILIIPFRLWLPVWLFTAVRQENRPHLNFKGIEFNRKLLFFFSVYTVVHIPFSMMFSDVGLTHVVSELINTWAFMITGCSIAAICRDWHDIRYFAKVVLFLFVIEVPIGFWEHVTGHHLAMSSIRINNYVRYMDYPTGTFYNPNNYASMLVLCSCFTFTGLLAVNVKKSTTLRWIIIAVYGISLPVIIWTGSRANMLAYCLVLVCAVLIPRRGISKRIFLRWGILGLIVALLAAPFVVDTSAVLNRFTGEVSTAEKGAAGRLALLEQSLSVLEGTFGLGAGQAGYHSFTRARSSNRTTAAHSLPGEIAASYGLVGLAIFGALYWHNMRELWKYRSNSYCFGAFLFWAISILSTASASSTIDQPFFWICVGLSLAILKVAHSKSWVDEGTLAHRRQRAKHQSAIAQRKPLT